MGIVDLPSKRCFGFLLKDYVRSISVRPPRAYLRALAYYFELSFDRLIKYTKPWLYYQVRLGS